jgi:hypothetical protein
MLERFDDHAELVFEGLGEPRSGIGAIRSAYLDRPPDEIVLLDERETAAGASGAYAWNRLPDVPAGELHLTVVGGRITRIVVTFA